jgi:hypothetical protein
VIRISPASPAGRGRVPVSVSTTSTLLHGKGRPTEPFFWPAWSLDPAIGAISVMP